MSCFISKALLLIKLSIHHRLHSYIMATYPQALKNTNVMPDKEPMSLQTEKLHALPQTLLADTVLY